LSSPDPGIVFHNGHVITGMVVTAEGRVAAASRCVEAQAVAVSGGIITHVGSDADVLGQAGAEVRRVDLRGLTLAPGFNDCHMHILGYGLKLLSADLSPDVGVRDTASLVAALRAWADANPTAPWVRGAGYNQNAFPGAAHVALAALDAAFPDRPVLVHHTSGHAALVNSRALVAAGVGPATADPAGGEIVRDARGVPTGVLLETAIGLVSDAVPSPTRAEMAAAVLRASQALSAVGITSASDMGVGGADTEAEVSAYRDAVAQGAPLRMTLCPDAAELGEPLDMPARDALAADWRLTETPDDVPGSLMLGALKLFADGALTTRTAALREPFVDTNTLGMLLHEPDVLRAYIRSGHEAGWQMAVHAIGDRAIELVLGAYESCRPGPASRRHRIEHCMMLDDALIARIVRLGAIAVIQPEFLARLGDAYVLGLGEDRASRLNPVRSLLTAGAPVAFSSDCPVVRGAPLDGIRAAQARTTPSGRILGPGEAVTALEALAAYTRGAAYAVLDEAVTGAIAPGYRADFVALDRLPDCEHAVAARQSHGSAGVSPATEAEVRATVVGGSIVYGADNLA